MYIHIYVLNAYKNRCMGIYIHVCVCACVYVYTYKYILHASQSVIKYKLIANHFL